MFKRAKEVPDVQYLGSPRTTESCLRALISSVEFDGTLQTARLLTCEGRHGFYLETDEPSPKVIRCGFTSGYYGEGPAGLALALALLARHQINVEEVLVEQVVLERLDQARLSHEDLELITSSQGVRPTRLYAIATMGWPVEGKMKAAFVAMSPW